MTGRGAAFTHSPDTLLCLPAASSPTGGTPPCLEDRQAGRQSRALPTVLAEPLLHTLSKLV